MGKTIKEIFTTNINTTGFVDNSYYTTQTSAKPFQCVYIAWSHAHDFYPEMVLGYFDTIVDAEQAIINNGYGGRIEQTTWDELTKITY